MKDNANIQDKSVSNGRPTVTYAPKLQRRSADTVRFYYVYILLCGDGKPYTGCTENLEERFERHMNGYVPATENRRPVQLITHIAFHDKYKAFNFEQYLKSGSGRAFLKKHKLIEE